MGYKMNLFWDYTKLF